MKDFSAIPAVPAVAGFQVQSFELKVQSDDERVMSKLGTDGKGGAREVLRGKKCHRSKPGKRSYRNSDFVVFVAFCKISSLTESAPPVLFGEGAIRSLDGLKANPTQSDLFGAYRTKNQMSQPHGRTDTTTTNH